MYIGVASCSARPEQACSDQGDFLLNRCRFKRPDTLYPTSMGPQRYGRPKPTIIDSLLEVEDVLESLHRAPPPEQ